MSQLGERARSGRPYHLVAHSHGGGVIVELAVRAMGRYLEPLRQQMTWFTLLRATFAEFGDVGLLFSTEDGWGNFTVGVTEGFDLLGRINITTVGLATKPLVK